MRNQSQLNQNESICLPFNLAVKTQSITTVILGEDDLGNGLAYQAGNLFEKEN